MIELASNPRNISFVQPFVEQVVEKYDVKKEVFGNILISVTEAVNNAILHGNNADEKKVVRLSSIRKKQTLIFKISDEGKGFDPNTLPDPTASENLVKLGGRGVFLMKELADRINFINNGSTVEIIFRL